LPHASRRLIYSVARDITQHKRGEDERLHRSAHEHHVYPWHLPGLLCQGDREPDL